MANRRISELQPLTANSASLQDLTLVVDVSDYSSPTGESKKMTLEELSKFVFSTTTYISSSNQLDINDLQSPPLSASRGGTGRTSLQSNGVLVGNGGNPVNFASGNLGEFLYINPSNAMPDFKGGVISQSAQVDYNFIRNTPTGILSSSGQLPPGLISSSNQISFVGLNDTPDFYQSDAFVVVNSQGNGIEYQDLGISVDDLQKGKIYSNGVYYFNGDIRERMYANIEPQSIYSGSSGSYYEDFLHSGNVYLDKYSRNLYFVRGTWPRRQGLNQNDPHGFSWREANDTIDSRAEAVCRTREDGQEFTVLADFWTSTIGNSLPNDVRDENGKFVVSEPSAVVFDSGSNKLFVACRNDHDESIIYRMNATGSTDEIEDSAEVWVKMPNGDLKIDCLEIGVVPEGFYDPDIVFNLSSSNNPSQNTSFLFFGTTPDWNKNTGSGSVGKHSAIYKVPTDVAPGQFQTDYPVAYTLHRFWKSGYDNLEPTMGSTGVKGIKFYIARAGADGGEWNPYSDPLSFVRKDKSRIFVVHSGAPSQQIVNNVNFNGGVFTSSFVDTLYASDYPIVPQNQPSQASPVLPGGSWTTASQPVFPILTPTFGPVIPAPSPNSINPGQPGIPGLYNNEQFGGHCIFELLIGNTGSVLTDPLTTEFSGIVDANRDFKTWRLGTIHSVSQSLALNLINGDDPAAPIGTIGSAPGAARNNSLEILDRLFISTAPQDLSRFDSGSFLTQSRGLCRISDVSCDLNTPRYFLDNTNGSIDDEGYVMVIPVIANSLDNESTGMKEGGQQGLQQLTVDPFNEYIYVADFFFSRYYSVYNSSVSINGYQNTFPYASTATPNTIYTPESTIPTTTPFAGGYDVNTDAIYWPTNPIYPGAPQGVPGYFYPLGWPFGATQRIWPNQNNAPVSITPSSNYFGPGDQFGGGAYYFTPSYYPKATFPPTPNYPNPNLGGYGQPASGSVDGSTSGSFYPAGPAALNATTVNTFTSTFSEFGAIYEAKMWLYSRSKNGQRIFDNQNPQIGYSRPCGLTGYNEGPNKVFRLIYTNGENNITLLNNDLPMGIYLNGLSRTFVKDGVMAQGHNVLSISDKGPGINGGLIVTMERAANTSDYVVIAQGSNGEFFGTGQQHNNNSQIYLGSINVGDAQNDASTYFGKNRNQFRLIYTGSLNLDVLYFSVIGGELGPIF